MTPDEDETKKTSPAKKRKIKIPPVAAYSADDVLMTEPQTDPVTAKRLAEMERRKKEGI